MLYYFQIKAIIHNFVNIRISIKGYNMRAVCFQGSGNFFEEKTQKWLVYSPVLKMEPDLDITFNGESVLLE